MLSSPDARAARASAEMSRFARDNAERAVNDSRFIEGSFGPGKMPPRSAADTRAIVHSWQCQIAGLV